MVERFGERMKEFRLSLGLNQVQLAARLGVTKQAVANIESGRRGASIEMLVILSDLGADLDYLVANKTQK